MLKTLVKALQAGDFASARRMFALQSSGCVTDEQLLSFAKTVKTDELVLYVEGKEAGVKDYVQHLMLQYAFKSHIGHPPFETVKIIFDASNRILSVRRIRPGQEF